MKNHNLTIAIPAYNEQNSLTQLLADIRRQSLKNLKEIILISDGSIDNTNKIIRDYKYSGVKINRIIDKQRKGKIYRLNQIFSHASTPFLIVLDADIKLEEQSLQRLLASAIKSDAVLTVSHQIPIEPSTFVGQVIFSGYRLWDDMRTSNLKYLDHVENFYGASSLYAKRFYSALKVPLVFQDERKFIYYSAKQLGKFDYEKTSVIYYHPVSTLRDFFFLKSREENIKTNILRLFGNNAKGSLKIPLKYKLNILGKHFFTDPFRILAFLILKYLTKHLSTGDPLISRGMWTISASTKTGFSSKNYA